MHSWWRGQDSNLRRQSRQIYSLFPLTAREPLPEIQSQYFPVFSLNCQIHRQLSKGTYPGKYLKFYETGAGDRLRTRDLLITNQLLYQLSYASLCFTLLAGAFYAYLKG